MPDVFEPWPGTPERRLWHRVLMIAISTSFEISAALSSYQIGLCHFENGSLDTLLLPRDRWYYRRACLERLAEVIGDNPNGYPILTVWLARIILTILKGPSTFLPALLKILNALTPAPAAVILNHFCEQPLGATSLVELFLACVDRKYPGLLELLEIPLTVPPPAYETSEPHPPAPYLPETNPSTPALLGLSEKLVALQDQHETPENSFLRSLRRQEALETQMEKMRSTLRNHHSLIHLCGEFVGDIKNAAENFGNSSMEPFLEDEVATNPSPVEISATSPPDVVRPGVVRIPAVFLNPPVPIPANTCPDLAPEAELNIGDRAQEIVKEKFLASQVRKVNLKFSVLKRPK